MQGPRRVGFEKTDPPPRFDEMAWARRGYSFPVIGKGSYSGVSSAFSGAVTL